MNELKPCPFCGGDAHVGTRMDEDIWSHNTVPYTQVQCGDCEVGTEWTCEGWEPTAQEAWNRRAASLHVQEHAQDGSPDFVRWPDVRNRGLLQAAKQAQAALKRWRGCAGSQPHADLIYEAFSYLEPAIEREEAFRVNVMGEDPMVAHGGFPAPVAVASVQSHRVEGESSIRSAAIEEVATMLDKKADNYATECGSVDPDTGTLEFGRGRLGQAREDHYNDLRELADEVRGMKGSAPVPADGGRAVPEGWKLVPMKPTMEMVKAGAEHAMRVDDDGDVYRARGQATAIYMDMLAAVLNPPLPRDSMPASGEVKNGAAATPSVSLPVADCGVEAGKKLRTDKDYAIEHAGYMADAARHLLAAINIEAVCCERHDEVGSAHSGERLAQAKERTGEAMGALRNRIYEFEKRRDRARTAGVPASLVDCGECRTQGCPAGRCRNAGVKECGTCAHKATPLGYGPCRGCRYSGYPNWEPEAAAGVPASDPRCDGCGKPRLQPGMCWRCRNPGVLPEAPTPGVRVANKSPYEHPEDSPTFAAMENACGVGGNDGR